MLYAPPLIACHEINSKSPCFRICDRSFFKNESIHLNRFAFRVNRIFRIQPSLVSGADKAISIGGDFNTHLYRIHQAQSYDWGAVRDNSALGRVKRRNSSCKWRVENSILQIFTRGLECLLKLLNSCLSGFDLRLLERNCCFRDRNCCSLCIKGLSFRGQCCFMLLFPSVCGIIGC